MSFKIIYGDITKQACDAIVNAANKTLLGGGGVDGAIHKAAGPKLLAECATLGGCGIGEVRVTKGYNLPAKYVIHTVGPVYRDGKHGEEKDLINCYRNSLLVALANDFKSVVFPLISAGAYHYPKEAAIEVAKREICKFLELRGDIMEVSLILYEPN